MAQSEKIFVPRFARQRLKDGGRSERQLISHWRDVPAYVLLGDPGAGKTEAVKREAFETNGQYITATDFGIVSKPKSAGGAVYFIDGLDEWRADASSETEALNAIRQKLVSLRKPKFRITCREIDWRGTVDGGALKAVSPDGEIVELHLEPLSDSDIQNILANPEYEVADQAVFWGKLAQLGLNGWLRNPMALELVLKAVLRGGNTHLPKSKLDIFQLGCEQLATETNPHHRAAKRRAPPPADKILDDAGKLFAILLLAGEAGINVSPDINLPTELSPASLPTELVFSNIQAALASPLFSTVAGHCSPRHRTIAEYLGAKAIGGLVKEGLPIGRVLAMMSGQDGGIVEPLRGLHAWMAVTCPHARAQLIDRDPLGVVMYGEVRSFSTHEKRQIFEALTREASRYAWFRQGAWNAHPFGALGTRDMVTTMQEILSSSERSLAHQSLLDCVIDAIRFGDDLPEMLPYLEHVVRDASFEFGIRLGALQAWLAQAKLNLSPALPWLNDIKAGHIQDANGFLRGTLLKHLYPVYLAPQEIVSYLYQTDDENSIALYGHFLSDHLLAQTPIGSVSELADAFASLNLYQATLAYDHELHLPIGKIVVAALRETGNESPTHRVISWLQIGRDGRGGVAIKGDEIGRALGESVETLKKIYAELCSRVEADTQSGNFDFASQTEFLYGAKLPADWYTWLLTLAEKAKSSELACFYLRSAADMALSGPVDFDIRMGDVEDWVARNLSLWPQAKDWLAAEWTWPTDHWQKEQFQRGQEHRVEQLSKEKLRHQNYAEQFEKNMGGLINVGVLNRLALAYKNRLFGIGGDTPTERLQDLVGGGKTRSQAAFEHLKSSLTRPDLPMSDEILKSGAAGEEHLVRYPCLVAAEIAFAESPDVLKTWSDGLLQRLVAFWLTDGAGDEPEWFTAAVRLKPQLVAEVMVPFAIQTLRKRPGFSVTGLWYLAIRDDLTHFARAVIPSLLEQFPVRANEKQLSRLVEELLPAALKHLEPEQLAAIAANRLANKSMDAGQRIAWLALGTFQNNQASAKALVKFLGKSQSRVQHLIHALVGHTEREMNHLALGVETQSLLIELVGPGVSPAWPGGGGMVRPVDNVRDLCRRMIEALSSSTDPAATRELARLRSLPSLNAWFTYLDDAIHDNTRLVRAASFVHASPQKVASTLANHAPANAADLQALVLDQLLGLEQEIRGSDSNVLDQFWTDKIAGGSRNPQIENVCRDRLKPLLRSKLQPLGVQLDKESYAAGDKRMDLRGAISVDGRRRVLPIEIKKDSHTNVWTAWRDQLDKQYLNEPDSGGYGVYLVLWFGLKPTRLDGVKAKSADDMADMLKNSIPAADRTRITVVVMDLSPRDEPAKKSTAKKVAVPLALPQPAAKT